MEMEVNDGQQIQQTPKPCIRQFRCTEKILNINPKIEITGVGPLDLPLLPSAVDQLSRIGILIRPEDCDDMIDSKNLCRTWHFDPSDCSVNNPQWDEQLSEIVNNEIRQELRLRCITKIKLKLCKLLLHDGGGIPFTPCSDINASIMGKHSLCNNNNNEDVVFATLSVFLPSEHSNGDIIMTFKGFREGYDAGYSSGIDFNNFNEIFFSECNHMMTRPLTSDANLALVYNLVCSTTRLLPIVTDFHAITCRVSQFLKSWRMENDKHKGDVLSVVFDNKYKTGGLSRRSFAPCDHFVAIAEAARSEEYDVFFSKFTCYERIGSYRCGLGDLDLCDGEKSYTFSEIADWYIPTEEGREPKGIFNGYKGILSRKTASMCKNFTQRPANMKDRWHQQAALLLWPPENLDGSLMKEQVNLSVIFNMDLAKQLARFKSGHAHEQYCNVFTANIVRCTKETINTPVSFISLGSLGQFDSDASVFLINTFKKTNDRHVFQMFVEHVLKPRIKALSADLLKELIDCSIKFGLDLALPVIGTLVEDETAFYTAVTLLRELCWSKAAGSCHYEDVIAWFAPKLLDRLKVPLPLDEKKPEFRITPLMGHDYKVIATATSLLCIYSSLGDANWLLQVIQYIRQTPHRHPINTVTVHALHHWNSWLETEMSKGPDATTAIRFAVEQKITFIESCVEQLKQSSDHPPVVPLDWARVVNLACQCQYCKIIEDFMQHPIQSILDVSLGHAKIFERRNHVMEICEELSDLVTKQKSLQVLTLRKTKASYESQRKSYQQSMLAIENLIALLPPDHPLCRKQQFDSTDRQIPPTKKTKLEN